MPTSLLLFGDIVEQRFAYCYGCFRSMICLSFCLPVTFVYCAQTAEDIDTIYFAYDSALSLPDCVKIWL